jgi:hypothetical protein
MGGISPEGTTIAIGRWQRLSRIDGPAPTTGISHVRTAPCWEKPVRMPDEVKAPKQNQKQQSAPLNRGEAVTVYK